ncbi:MAG TPA: carboxypeptidase-like regulatory domain-containing protein [Candidatus Acidoferrum sp.]
MQEGKDSGQAVVQEFSIGGTVVDSVAGRGVGHALVVLTMYSDMKTSGGELPMRRVMADEEGRFEIRGLTSTGRAGIQAAKPGYEAATDVRTGLSRSFGGFQELDVEPGVNVTVTLVPEATIAGRVVDASGEPIERMPIHLTFEGALNGRRVPQDVRRGGGTDEEGEFRFADLQAGRYFVSAGPSEEVSSRSGAGGRTALGYATVFYGGGTDYATASPIDLTAGKHVDIDLRMELQPLFKIRGVVTGSLATGLRQIAIFNAANQRLVNRSEERSDQEFQIAELPRGSYTIHVSSLDPETRECTATIKRLDVTRDISGLQLALSPCATITVNIHVEHTKKETNKTPSNPGENGLVTPDMKYPVQAGLRPDDERGMTPTYHGLPKKDEPETAIAHGVTPGRYILEVPLIRQMYVESMQSGMTDLLREDLVVAPGAAVAPVEVRLRDDGALLDGKVKLDPGVKTAAVIAIPVETPRLARNAIVLSGQFNFPPLAPGRYELFAVDHLDDFAYAEQDVIGKYLAHAKEVTLRANERTTVELEFVRLGREGQP